MRSVHYGRAAALQHALHHASNMHCTAPASHICCLRCGWSAGCARGLCTSPTQQPSGPSRPIGRALNSSHSQAPHTGQRGSAKLGQMVTLTAGRMVCWPHKGRTAAIGRVCVDRTPACMRGMVLRGVPVSVCTLHMLRMLLTRRPGRQCSMSPHCPHCSQWGRLLGLPPP